MLKKIFPTLGRFRFAIQLLMLLFTVYGSALIGHYAAEKVSNTLPALSCAFDKQNGAYCVLVPLQHQMHHRIGEALVQGQQVFNTVVLPLFFLLLSFFTFFVVLNKAFCGWICPLGTMQELLFRLGRRFNRPFHRLKETQAHKARPVKWLMLLVLVLGLPLLAGMGIAPDQVGDPFCQVCPSRLATTLLTADTEQIAVRTGHPINFALGALGNALFGFILIAALAARQPFCRICPLLSLNAAFQKLSPMRLSKQPHEKCEKCGICTKACPMDIHEIWKKSGHKAFNEDCTLCGRCAEYCPDDGVIQIKFFGLPLFKSSRDYYKARVKSETPEGMPKGKVIWLKPADTKLKAE
ncbi:MAG: 4Fe-4S binding protein [Nitrosomonadales bacterium]|nr:4Fe-4S binding protein [Nitrosomonadales bacterium]